ncbi:elongation factor 1-beta [Methanosphaera sp. Vir-13MRS]|jgi:elongation factor 1-beta|uniref:elongation factor 1-beta n=1 Tax=Candidatus Methanosphaera massiliense TaxID=3017187 RepID=UPI002380C2BE|nr:elongation factor 1-beta [Candidatus Methanosphaera massiliense]MDE4077548.1 elongation factor 1-beta [Candidatus Methanosphaera massiliense]
MSDVVAILKVMPESPDVDLDALKESVKSVLNDGEFERVEEEPIGFGLVALNVTIVVDDGEGGTEPAEQAIADLDEVQSVEVTDVRRLM